MAILSIKEIIDLILMTVILGFIFKDSFRIAPTREYDPLQDYKHGFSFNQFYFACLATAPAVILHEFGHKFVAMFLGLTNVTFHANYTGLMIGAALKYFTGIILFIPGYVTHPATDALGTFLIALAGPGMNLILWFIARELMKQPKRFSSRMFGILSVTKQINLFLFFFNLIPIPPFDGYSVFSSLFQLIF